MRRLTVLSAALAAAGLLAVGCGDDSGTSAPVMSFISIHAQIKQGSTIPTPLLNKQLVGILRDGADSTKVQTKIHPAITDTFTLEFDSLVAVGSKVIIDAFVDSDADGVYDRPADTSAVWTAWPEPSVRWQLNPVAHDSLGGHGVTLTIFMLANQTWDIGDIAR